MDVQKDLAARTVLNRPGPPPAPLRQGLDNADNVLKVVPEVCVPVRDANLCQTYSTLARNEVGGVALHLTFLSLN